jgi:hypothetical protein
MKPSDVPLRAGVEIVYTENIVSFREQSLAKMRTDESGASGD